MDDFQDSDVLVKSLRSGEERAFVYLFDNEYSPDDYEIREKIGFCWKIGI